jgi:hypothetical protein
MLAFISFHWSKKKKKKKLRRQQQPLLLDHLIVLELEREQTSAKLVFMYGGPGIKERKKKRPFSY